MCIAIYKPAGKQIETNTLYKCWENNPDGAGFVFPDGSGGLALRKGFMKWKEFKKAWKSVKNDLLNKPVVLHFRIATHGVVTPANTHPFWVAERHCAVAHNGILSGTGAVYGTGAKTDTEIFTEQYLAPLYKEMPGCFKSETIVRLLSRVCGSSKLAIMQDDGSVSLINERDGLWDDGIWYSNGGYKHSAVVVYGSSFGQGNFTKWRSRSGGYYDDRDKEWARAWLHNDDMELLDIADVSDLKSEQLASRLTFKDDLFLCIECDKFYTGDDVEGYDIEECKCPSCGDWVYHQDSVYYCAPCKQYTLFENCEVCNGPTLTVSELLIKCEEKKDKEG